MTDFAFYALVGLGPGAILGLLGLGLVVVYRSTGVLNLAHTSQAAVGAYAYVEFSDRFEIPLGMAVAGAALCSGITGAAIQALVMRPLASASRLTRLIASTGVLTVLQATLLLLFTDTPRTAPSLLPSQPVQLWADRTIGSDRLLLVVIVVALATALWLAFRYTRWGVVTSAVAENPLAAAALGHDPGRLAVGTWFLGGALAGLAGALLAPISGVSLILFVSLLMPVLAAALGGGLTSFPLTVATGLLIGVAQAVTTRYAGDLRGGSAIPTFVILVALMLLRGKAIPERGFVGSRMPSIGSGNIRWPQLAVAASIILGLIWLVLPSAWNQAILTSMLVAVPMLSVVVVTGYAGQVALAQFALAGVGAVVATKIAVQFDSIPFVALLLIGGLGAVPVGFLLAVAARRMRGESLAIVTLGFNVFLFATVFSSASVVVVPRASFLGWDLSPLADARPYATLVILVFIVLALATANLRRSQTGRSLLAVRGNERGSASIGISVNGTKTKAFCVSAFIAGVGGVLIAFRSTAVVLGDFNVLASINQLGWTVIGGVGFLLGPLFGMGFASGGVGNQIIDDLYTDQFVLLPLLGGIALLLTILANPDGVASVVHALRRRIVKPRRVPPATKLRVLESPSGLDARRRATLELRDVSVSFGGVHALKAATLRVDPGTVHGLIGPNGAGKTTLLDAVSGFLQPDSGDITLGQTSLRGMPAWRRSRLGLGRSFQNLELFDDLSVCDNILSAAEIGRRSNLFRDLAAPRTSALTGAAAEAVRMLKLEDVLDSRIQELSYGKRHLVAIARALASDSDVILLDEPASGLDQVEVAELRTLIREIADSGIGVLLIEHDVELVMAVSDVVTALNFGEVIASGPPTVVRSDPKVIASYLGESVDEPSPSSEGGTL